MDNKRYWITDDHVVIREWSQNEYDNLEPTVRIKENVLWNVCMNCGRPFSVATGTTEEANGNNANKHFCPKCKRKEYNIFFKPKDRNNGYAYLMTELRCFETCYRNICNKQCFATTVY